jgi:hypothetical protein
MWFGLQMESCRSILKENYHVQSRSLELRKSGLETLAIETRDKLDVDIDQKYLALELPRTIPFVGNDS